MRIPQDSAYSFDEHVVAPVLNALKQKFPSSASSYSVLKSFIEQFYSFSYSTDVRLTSEFLLDVAEDLYNFIGGRKPQESMVRVFLADRPGFPGESLTVVETAHDNMPFIIDSVIIALKKHGLPIYHYTNAVLLLKRENGKIVEVDASSTKPCTEGYTRESVAYFVVESTSTELQHEIKVEVERALRSVTHCVGDWHPMLDQVDELISHMKEDVSHGEVCDFLRWLREDNFVFLGYSEYEASKSGSLLLKPERSLGLQRIGEAPQEPEKSPIQGGEPLYVVQSNCISHVHRHGYMVCIGLRILDRAGSTKREGCFYGFFTSSIEFQSACHIPVIRKKVELVEKRSGFLKNGHNSKALMAIMQKFSREELFRFSEEDLFQISMGILFLSSNQKVKSFILKDVVNNFIGCIIFIPKNLASTELANRIASVLEKVFDGKVVGQYYNMYDESDLVRLQFTVKTDNEASHTISAQEVERIVVESTKRWEDRLQQVVSQKLEGDFSAYVNAFPASYQEYFTPENARHDILKIHKVLESSTGESEADLYLLESCSHYQLKIYVPLEGDLNLSKVLDVVKKMGAKMSQHYSYDITVRDKCVRLHHFVLANTSKSFDHRDIKGRFETTLKKVFSGEIENDYFNSLAILANLKWKEVLLVRTLSRYLKQISFNYSQAYIQKVVRKNSNMVHLFVRLFEARFDPDIKGNRAAKVASVRKSIDELFTQVSDIVHDYILKCIYNLISAVLRTNYYQDARSYLSIKLDSSAVPDIPKPYPFREIYVYSNTLEGIHLRGGKVARGGIRWSDRTEDFRTEVLGLMKAQMTKNSVIVPVGSKGGFVLKGNSRKLGSVECAVECYKNFLRGILDITDNIVDGKCITPDRVIRYDDDDPYLVVAADKGTASFSDHANKVSAEYSFWLGDAFASGGSVGFDHKKIGITAKGAWVAAQRHFWVMGKDIQKDTFTAIGIGDMSGDVFGNGMLLSDKIRLLGAFNHIHIFVDPSPDPATSFVERKRLFETPGSSWKDYKPELISEGGGVFCRNSKAINLTPEMKKCFRIVTDDESISPTALIRSMLKAPVDMIWNGGIGTYVKSSKETHITVGDKANDRLRIDGKDVRAAMVIEGGNLGCTQLGRVEYANNGGRINTDFVDNAGGVICSDFEVNLKICLEMAVKDKFISLEERNKILYGMLNDIPNILMEHHNKLETRTLMLECMQAQKRIEQHHRIMQYLEKIKVLDRSIEFLPSDEEVLKMVSESRGLDAPQIAVLIAYVRTFIKGEIIKSNLLKHGLADIYESQYLLSYFPECIRNKFGKYIKQHKLKHEILATCISNDIVNRMGCVFVSHIESMGITIDTIARVYVIISMIYNLQDIWSELDRVDGTIDASDYVKIVREVQKFVGQATFWLFRHMHKFVDIEKRLGSLSAQTLLIEQNMENILCGEFLESYNAVRENFPWQSLSPEIAQRIKGLQFLVFAMDIIYLAESTGVDIVAVGKVYFRLRSVLSFSRIRELAMQMDAVSPYWQRIAIRNLLDDLSDYQSIITGNIVRHVSPEEKAGTQKCMDTVAKEHVDSWCTQYKNQLDGYYRFLEDINSTQLDLSKLVLVIRSLSVFTVGKDYHA
ncbi:NAD-glutamate dehydrogenase [Anaplasma capra]|uniref:NAD-glutamate dehydrogenase n=1 Tax=Anaplasma capra TaxID=1562740 RepID=UPI0021D5848A|nr:NAD-glutamate dehydrogenase [Anaplasma capra]MCU7611472.1 NAD-glutamate dehydrogenase [Anaplasma capra]